MLGFKKKFLSQEGQVIVIVSLLIVSFFGITALAIDVGSLYQERRHLQTVADSAALAGAQELPDDPDKAIQVAVDYALKHDVNISYNDVVISNTLTSDINLPDTITVTPVNPGKDTYFAKVLDLLDSNGETDFNKVEVAAMARAMVAKPLEKLGIVPWGIDEDEFRDISFGDPKQFYFATIDEIGPGNFGCLDLPRGQGGSGGANDYYDNILYGYNKGLAIEDIISSKPGKMPQETDESVDDRVNDPLYGGDGKDEFDYIVFDYPVIKNDTQVVYVPVITVEEKQNGKFETTIVDFAIFVLTEWDKDGKDAYVKGQFIKSAITNSNGSILPVEAEGLRVVRLIK
jgi:Flp pilus assembly protein TadG